MLNFNAAGHNPIDADGMNPISKQLSAKIDNYLILCVYEQDYKFQDHAGLEWEQSKNLLAAMPLSADSKGSNTFIIWDRVYQESTHVFNSLRLAARNRLIRHISNNIVNYLLTKYKKFSPIFSTILNNAEMKSRSIHYFEEMLKRDTFLVNEDVWDNFCDWFRICLTEWVLEEMAQTLGEDRLVQLDKKELNEQFYQFISMNFSQNKNFITRFTSIVNNYSLEWVEKIITFLNLENYSIQQIESLLCKDISISEHPSSSPVNEFTFNSAVNDCIFVMNNAPYQSVREALYKMSFTQKEEFIWPTSPIMKSSVEGILQIKPFKKDYYPLHKDHPIVKETWEEVKVLSDLEADIFDALCTFFLSNAKHPEDVVEIQLDDLLAIRGLKPKMGGEGRRGGYEEKQRRQVMKSLSIIQKLWIDLEKTIVYEKGKPAETELQGRAFLFVDQNRVEYPITEETSVKKISYKVDQVFSRYLFGSGRQVALLPLKVLHYDPYRKSWEKRLTRYLSWRWRIQAKKGDYLQPNKINTLLDAIGVKINERTPSRTRERLEKALDTLQQDGVIGAWHYEKWEESIADQKGWGRIWLNSMITIQPPEFIREQYHPIKRSHQGQNIRQPQKEVLGEEAEMIGVRVREIRETFDLALAHVSEELEISTSYLSNIERGIKIPSKKIQFKLMKWLKRFE